MTTSVATILIVVGVGLAAAADVRFGSVVTVVGIVGVVDVLLHRRRRGRGSGRRPRG